MKRAVASSAATDAALKAWVVLNRAQQSVARLAEADIARHGLSPAEFGVLDVLYHRGPLLLGEVQQKVLVSSGGVTYLVDRLAEKGLVERKACETDRRARYAALTSAGRTLMVKVFPEHAQAIARALSSMSRAELAELTGMLRQLGTAAAGMASLPDDE